MEKKLQLPLVQYEVGLLHFYTMLL